MLRRLLVATLSVLMFVSAVNTTVTRKKVSVNGGANSTTVGSNALNVSGTGGFEAQEVSFPFASAACTTSGTFATARAMWSYSGTLGKVMLRPGAIVGVEGQCRWTVTSGSIPCRTCVYKNGSAVYCVSMTQSATGTYNWPSSESSSVQDRDDDTFVAGDVISERCDEEFNAGVGSCARCSFIVKVRFNT